MNARLLYWLRMHDPTYGIVPPIEQKGEWIPQFGDDSLDGTGEGQVYSVQVGGYVKIGSQVFIQGQLALTSFGTLTGTETMRILGLPFPSINIPGNTGGIRINFASGLNLPKAGGMGGFISANSEVIVITLDDVTTGPTGLLVSEFSSDGNIIFSGSYRASE